MEIVNNKSENKLVIAVSGRLDTTTAPKLEADVRENIEGITELVFDFANLEYVSSAGLRVILNTQKTMNKQGSMSLVNVCSDVMEVFDITGFSEILTIN